MRLVAHRAAVAQALVCSIAVAAPAFAQPQMPAVLDLYTAIPQPPATPQDAATWFDASGTLVHPGLVALKQQIATHRSTLDGRSASRTQVVQPGPGHTPVSATTIEPAAVQDAVEAARLVLADADERRSVHLALWQTNDAAVAKIAAAPLARDCPAADARIARAGEVLALRRSAFAQARENASPLVRDADAHLKATLYGTVASSPLHTHWIQALDRTALGEIEQLVASLEDIAKTASNIVRAEQAKTRALNSRQ